MARYLSILFLGFAISGCASSSAYAKNGSYEFKSKENRIQIDKRFRYVVFNGKRQNLENCSDAFIVCANGYISFSIPRRGCSKAIDEIPKLSEMNFAARDHHSDKSWRYNSKVKNVIFEYNGENDIVAIYYDFSSDGQAISKFIDLENGRSDDISPYRLEAVQPISATSCKDVSE